MAATARTAWLDAWEGSSTPSYRARRDDRSTRRYREEGRPLAPSPRVQGPTKVRQSPAIEDYDWEAAARRRPGRNECERVILHADRTIEARASSSRYYSRDAAARVADPRPQAARRVDPPRLRVIKHKASRWRLGLIAGIVGVLLVAVTVVAPIITSSVVAGLESAVGQAEAQQQELAAETAALSAQISSLSSPQRVAAEAAQLGLVPANDVSYLATGGQMLASEGDTTVAGR